MQGLFDNVDRMRLPFYFFVVRYMYKKIYKEITFHKVAKHH